MENPSLQIGDNNWAVKDGSILGYNIIQDNYLPQPIDFTRASSATRVNESGLIEEVATGVPRIDYTTGSPALLLEPQRTNEIIYSTDIPSNAAYLLGGTTNTSGQTSPTGGTDAYLIAEDSTTAEHFIDFGRSSTTTNTNVTSSFFIKPNGRNKIRITNYFNLVNQFAWVELDLANNSLIQSSSANVSYVSHTITDFPNGWKRVSLTTIKAISTYSYAIRLNFLDNLGNLSYLGDGVSGAYVYGIQQEHNAAYPTSLINTAGTSVTRVSDSASKSGISSLIGQTQGTIFFDLNNVTGTVTGTGNPEIAFRNTAFNNWMGVTTNTFANPFRFTFRSATTLIDYSANITRAKVACSYGAFGVKLFVNGALVASSVTIPTTTFDILDLKGGIIKSELTSVMSFLLPKSDAELIALTTI